MSSRDEAREDDRRKSRLKQAAAATGILESGASPAPTSAGKQSVGVKAALAALRIYKVYLSVLFAGSCRFEPTCSRYAYEAIERFGVMRGSWMGLGRLLRCQPLSRKFGYDPVPEKAEAPASKLGYQPVPEETEAKASRRGGIGQDNGRPGVASREAHS
jgi:putative membrane protein insertion efficiency factor